MPALATAGPQTFQTAALSRLAVARRPEDVALDPGLPFTLEDLLGGGEVAVANLYKELTRASPRSQTRLVMLDDRVHHVGLDAMLRGERAELGLDGHGVTQAERKAAEARVAELEGIEIDIRASRDQVEKLKATWAEWSKLLGAHAAPLLDGTFGAALARSILRKILVSPIVVTPVLALPPGFELPKGAATGRRSPR